MIARLKKIWSVPEIGILLPLILCAGFFTWLSPLFLGPESVRAILRALAFIGLIAVGQTFLMIAGEIDLSVGSVAGLCAVASAWLMKFAGWPPAPVPALSALATVCLDFLSPLPFQNPSRCASASAPASAP